MIIDSTRTTIAALEKIAREVAVLQAAAASRGGLGGGEGGEGESEERRGHPFGASVAAEAMER